MTETLTDPQAPGTHNETGTIEPGRGKDGRFLPGNRFKPPDAHRRKGPDYALLIKELSTTAPPTRMAGVVDQLLNSQSDKIRLATIQWLHDVMFGKPVQRQITATDTMENFIKFFAERREAEEEIIDVDGTVVHE